MKPILTTLILFFAAGTLFCQPEIYYTEDDKAIFDQYAAYIEPYRTGAQETVLEKTALFFLGRPYVAHTLEVTDGELLVANLREFDCVTFVETVMALAKAAVSDEPAFEKYLDELRKIRYRQGIVGDYSSRLHYTSDWLYENEQNGFLNNISRKLGGVVETKEIDFMSAHRDAYRQLKNDSVMLEKIVGIEKTICKRGGFYYLPKDNIKAAADRIPHMAMIGFTTGIEGLDTTHVGFVFRQNGRLTFIHASSSRKEVMIDEKSLSDYCASQKMCTGIILAEVLPEQ